MSNSHIKQVKISFLGDISLNDAYNIHYEKGESPFQSVTNSLISKDLVVGNIECFAESEEGENLLKKPRLKTKLVTLNYLKDINLGLACLANNHVYDNLEDGFNKTIDFLDNNEIDHTGASTSGNESEPYIYQKNGIKIAILNYVSEDTHPNLPLGSLVKLNWFSIDNVIRDIKRVRNIVDHIVLFPHWGGTMEGSIYPDKGLVESAHKLIDSGVDLIIGHHSHTLQPYETYKNKHIFYSLGNFCLADIYSDGCKIELDKKRSDKSAIINVDFFEKTYTVDADLIQHVENKVIIAKKSCLHDLKNYKNADAWLKYTLFWQLYYFYEKSIYIYITYLFANNRNPFKQLMSVKRVTIKKHLLKLLKHVSGIS